MAVSLGSNIDSLRALRYLGRSSSRLEEVFQRLSSGKRINRASDDAAGLAIASSLGLSTRVYTQAIRNVNDGISALSTAEGSLNELSGITIRLKELASEAANGTYSLTQRKSLQSEADQLVSEYNRTLSATTFNGQNLLNGTLGQLNIQSGFGSATNTSVALSTDLARSVGDGTFTAGPYSLPGVAVNDVAVGDLNNDNNQDIVFATATGLRVLLGNGDGNFQAVQSYNIANAYTHVVLADTDADGDLDVVGSVSASVGTLRVQTNNGSGDFSSGASIGGFTAPAAIRSIVAQDFNGDGKVDLGAVASGKFAIRLNDGTGSFGATDTYTFSGAGVGATAGDFNNDGKLDVAISTSGGKLDVLLNTGLGAFSSPVQYNIGSISNDVVSGDVNRDGILDLIVQSSGGQVSYLAGDGKGSFQSVSSISTGLSGIAKLNLSDFNNDGYLDILADSDSSGFSLALGHGDGSFDTPVSHTNSSSNGGLATADFNEDGVVDIASGGGATLETFFGTTTSTNNIAYLNLLSQSNALSSLSTIDGILSNIARQLGTIGSSQSRLQANLNNITSQRDNFDAAGSRILDADIAQETAELSRNNILRQLSTSLLSQANSLPALALQLLR